MSLIRRSVLKSNHGGGGMKRLIVLTILIVASAANAQTFRGAINGAVTDPLGAVIPNAQVKATEIATGLEHNTATTSDGQFAFQDVPLGLYKVTISAPGFRDYAADQVLVVAGTVRTL